MGHNWSVENLAQLCQRANVCGLRRTCFVTVLLGRNLRTSVTDNEPVVRSDGSIRSFSIQESIDRADLRIVIFIRLHFIIAVEILHIGNGIVQL